MAAFCFARSRLREVARLIPSVDIILPLPCGARKVVDSLTPRAARSWRVKFASSDKPPLTFFPLGENCEGFNRKQPTIKNKD
jgi:hypothetical protein